MLKLYNLNMDNLFSNQQVELKGKIVFDFSNPLDIINRKLIVNNTELEQALLKFNLVDKITEVKIIIETL